MLNLVNLLSNVFTTGNVQQTTSITKTTSSNPFANPFVNAENVSTNPFANYAKNNPVRGGYFAGYYNGKSNIVGQKLFIEV